jgi:hypothetical protein
LQVDKTQVWLHRLARISAWLLLTGVAVLIVSGWGITQTGVIYRLSGGLIDRRLADSIHRAANAPLAFFFLCHVFINISLMAARHNRALYRAANALFLAVGAGIMAIVIYMEYFRTGG